MERTIVDCRRQGKSDSRAKEVRLTEAAGPALSYAFLPPVKRGCCIGFTACVAKGGFRWGHEGTHAEAERRFRLEGPKLGFGLTPFPFYCFFFFAAFFLAAFFLAAITVSYG
jgi:hypothetical protein